MMLFLLCRKHIVLCHTPSFSRATAGQLLSFGGWVTITSFVGPMMVILDRFIIGALSGAKAVAYYTVPFQLGERSTLISNSLGSALFPRLASATQLERHHLVYEGLSTLAVIMTPLIAAGVFFMETFLTLWIDPTFALHSSLSGQILLLGFWVNGFARIVFAQLQASGRPDLVAKCHMFEVIPYFVILYLSLTQFGLFGAAMAFSLRVVFDFILLARLADILQKSLYLLLSPSLLLAASFLIASLYKMGQREWFLLVAVHLILSLTWSWRNMPDSLRELVTDRLKLLKRCFPKNKRGSNDRS
jgi:O-antigen/teichoic acid export membrane protein